MFLVDLYTDDFLFLVTSFHCTFVASIWLISLVLKYWDLLISLFENFWDWHIRSISPRRYKLKEGKATFSVLQEHPIDESTTRELCEDLVETWEEELLPDDNNEMSEHGETDEDYEMVYWHETEKIAQEPQQ
jgi:hypothetical protein